ncbi:MAG TPA: fimbrial protein [Lysobacter sp.]
MKTTLLRAATIGVIAMASQAALAADGTINITGELTTQTCSINGAAANGARDIAVPLQPASQSNLSTVGSTSTETPFSVTLTACTPATGTVSTRFESGANVDTATGELLTSGAGGSTGLHIQLLNQDRTVIVIGAPDATQNSAPGTLAAGAVTLNYIARYRRASAAALSVGAVTSSVTYSLAYN